MRNRVLLSVNGNQSTLIKSISILRYLRAPSPFHGFKSVHRGKEEYLGNQRYEVKSAEREEGSYDTGCSSTFRVARTPDPLAVKSSIRGKILTVPHETMLGAHTRHHPSIVSRHRRKKKKKNLQFYSSSLIKKNKRNIFLPFF